jgi:hypothetical protein
MFRPPQHSHNQAVHRITKRKLFTNQFPLQYFPEKKRVCPCSSKVTISNKVVCLFDENVKVEPKLNLGFFAVCSG